jgi:hypothetical protein
MKNLHIFITAILAMTIISCSTEVDQESFFEGAAKSAVYASISSKTSGIMKENGSGFFYMVDFKFSPEELISADNTVYRQEFARYAACMATDVYDNSMLSLINGTASPSSAADNTTIYSNFGFKDAKEFKLLSSDYTTDTEDITNFVISHSNISSGSTEYEIIMLTVQGSNATREQWYSNFDIGSTNAAYTSETGTHPEWTDTNYHKGFFITAKRADAKIQQYITDNVSSTAKKIIFLTGHSRGAAITNILGAWYEKSTAFEKTFTYTFASPFVTTNKTDSATYKTIFNIVNADDLVTILPAESWNFTRNGITKKASIIESESLKSAWYLLIAYQREAISGEYVSSGANSAACAKNIASSSANRDELYTIGNTEDDLYCLAAASEDEAKTRLKTIRDLKIDKFANLSIVENNGKYTVQGYMSPAFMFNFIPAMIVSSSNAVLMNGLPKTGKYNAAAQVILVAAANGGLAKSHDPSCYYLLTENM